MEGGITGITVDHLIPIVRLGTEAYLAISLKQPLHLLEFSSCAFLSLGLV
jgi:hypothetical protein